LKRSQFFLTGKNQVLIPESGRLQAPQGKFVLWGRVRGGDRRRGKPKVAKEPLDSRDYQVRSAKRLIRAVRKIAYDIVRGARREEKKPEPPRERRTVKLRILIDDRNGITPHLVHEKMFEFDFDVREKVHQLRKGLIRKLRLKGVDWSLEQEVRVKDGRGVRTERCDLKFVMERMVRDEQAVFVVRAWKARSRIPNAPGTSKRVKLARANQRTGRRLGLKSYVWAPEPPRKVEISIQKKSRGDGLLGMEMSVGPGLREAVLDDEQLEEKWAHDAAERERRREASRKEAEEWMVERDARAQTRELQRDVSELKYEDRRIRDKTMELRELAKKRTVCERTIAALDEREGEVRLREEQLRIKSGVRERTAKQRAKESRKQAALDEKMAEIAATREKEEGRLAVIRAKEARRESEIEAIRKQRRLEVEPEEHEEAGEEEETEEQRARRRRNPFEAKLEEARVEKVEADRIAAMMEQEEERRREIQTASDRRHAAKGSKGKKPEKAAGRKRKL
jgi:hypothetical protein